MKSSKVIWMGIGWVLTVGTGLGLLNGYSTTAGTPAVAPATWPAECDLQRDPARPTLVMLVHPRCPCSRASIGELERLMTHCRGRATAFVLFIKPPDTDTDWERTDLWNSAAAIAGVTVLCDRDGSKARALGVSTSGQVLLYNTDDCLVFRGGITAARGHAGDNAGRSAIMALLSKDAQARLTTTPVFGCPLHAPVQTDRAGEQP